LPYGFEMNKTLLYTNKQYSLCWLSLFSVTSTSLIQVSRGYTMVCVCIFSQVVVFMHHRRMPGQTEDWMRGRLLLLCGEHGLDPY